MDTWETHYQEYRHFVLEALINPPTIVISPDNDDLPAEECISSMVVGSYEPVD